MVSSVHLMTKHDRPRTNKKVKRGRLAVEEWQVRARYALRHLDDPIALQRSPLCRLVALERLAKDKYPQGVVAKGRALSDLIQDCLREIEDELDGHAGVAKLKSFIYLTRKGNGVSRASRSIGISPEHASRTLKRNLVELLTEKLLQKLRT
ncbi:hypothetical protein ACFLYB_00335 [Chloroflexota bacterium]